MVVVVLVVVVVVVVCVCVLGRRVGTMGNDGGELGEEGKRLTQVSTYRGAADISGSRGDDECRSLLGRASEHL